MSSCAFRHPAGNAANTKNRAADICARITGEMSTAYPSAIRRCLRSRAIKDMFKGKAENLPTPALIVSEVCQYYNIEEQVLRSTLKNKNTAEARQVAMYLIRTMTNLSLPEIGREFARDHTTVMHGLKKVEQTLQNSASPLNDTIRDITANINNKL